MPKFNNYPLISPSYDDTALVYDQASGAVKQSTLANVGRAIFPVFSASWYGVKADGSTDDTTALRNAVAAVTAIGGGTLLLPSGNIRISDQINLPSNFLLKGAGVGATIITQSGANKCTLNIESVNNVTVGDFSMVGGSAGITTPSIQIYSSGSNAWNNRVYNVNIDSLGNLGVGILIRSSNMAFVGFTAITDVEISGGAAASWSSKIGIQIGKDDGSFHVVRTNITGGRVQRCHHGIVMDNCDTVTSTGLGLDDCDGNGLDFNRAGLSYFNYVAFEGGTFGKYINFGVNSADNTVWGSLANATTLQVTDSGIRNSYFGSDGTGGLINKENFGPVNQNQNVTFLSRLMFGVSGTFGASSQTATDGAGVRLGSIACGQKTNPADSGDATFWNLGGTHSTTGPGGSNVTHNYYLPFTAGRPAVYLVSCLAVSTAGSPTTANRTSILLETASGSFTEINLNNAVTGGASLAFVFGRSGSDLTIRADVLTNDGTSANVTRNVVRIN